MGLLDRLRRKPSDLSRVIVYEGTERLEVRGEASYQEALSRAAGGKTTGGVNVPVTAVLRRDPRNRYDANAIAVYVANLDLATMELVGHLSAEFAAEHAGALDRIEASGHHMGLRGHIVGGWDRGGGDEGDFGIWLEYDPDDFA